MTNYVDVIHGGRREEEEEVEEEGNEERAWEQRCKMSEKQTFGMCDMERLEVGFRGWLHERFHVRFHVRFAANRRCDLVYLQFGVAHGFATVYT
jgi:hypothetical protein